MKNHRRSHDLSSSNQEARQVLPHFSFARVSCAKLAASQIQTDLKPKRRLRLGEQQYTYMIHASHWFDVPSQRRMIILQQISSIFKYSSSFAFCFLNHRTCYMLLLLLTFPQQWALQAASLVACPVESSSEGKVGQLAPVKFHRILVHDFAAPPWASPSQVSAWQQQWGREDHKSKLWIKLIQKRKTVIKQNQDPPVS